MLFNSSDDRCPPVPKVLKANALSDLALYESVVKYVCVKGYRLKDPKINSYRCDGTNWVTEPIIICESMINFDYN